MSQPLTPAAIEIRGTNTIGGPCSASPVGGLKGLGAGAYGAPQGGPTQVKIKGLFVLTFGAEEV